MGRIGRANKEVLAEAIFVVENEREHRKGLHDRHVDAMRAARNCLYDRLGWNEAPRSSAPSGAA